MRIEDTFKEKLTHVVIFLIIFGAFWQLSTFLFGIPEYFIPSPFNILEAFGSNLFYLFLSSLITLNKILFGFFVGAFVGFFLSIMIFNSKILRRTLYPTLLTFNLIPKITLVPLLIIWFGFNLFPQIALIVLMSFFPIIINTTKGLESVSSSHIDLMNTLSSTKMQTLFKVQIPSALPHIFSGLKTSVLLSVTGAIIGEFLIGNKGLGHLIASAQMNFETSLAFAGIILISIMGVFLFQIVGFLERKILFWNQIIYQ